MKRTTKCCVFLTFLLVALAFRVVSADIREGVVGQWTFDEGEGTTALDEARLYGQVLSEDEALELFSWAGGADAGPDCRVYGGETVTLTGSGPADATSFHWDQVGGTPTVTLQPSPDQATVEFTAPALEIGTVLSFRLTVDAPSTQGQTTDEVQVMVRAVNAPKLPLTNIHVLPLDLGPAGLGCRIIWDPVLDAEKYEIGLEFDGIIIWLVIIGETSYEVKGMTEGQFRTITIRAINKFGVSTLIARIGYVAMPNLARPAALGGKYPPERNICKVKCAPSDGPMSNDANYRESWDSWDGLYKDEDYWGYLWSQPLFFDHVVYVTGEMFADGGWFLDLKVQYTNDGNTWLNAPIKEIYPEYDFSDQLAGKKPFTRYDLCIPTLRGTGIRIYGTPGGTATFTSIAELEVFGHQLRISAIGQDAEFPEGATAFLDGSLSFSVLGPITSYQWTGPAGITITNPTSSIASFQAPYVAADTLYVFALQVSDGTNTDTDNDVQMLVRNLVTTAVAGPDQSVIEGTEVTLNACSSRTTTEAITYLWTQTGGTDVGVTGSTSCIVTFVAPMVWDYEEMLTFRLDVDDGEGGTSSDELIVTVRNALAWPAYPVTYSATTSYLQNMLHLGTYPTDRLLNPHSWGNIRSGFDPLESFGGVRSIQPYPGLEFDFTGTGVQVSRNPMVWTPVFSNTGIFDNTGLDNFQMHYNVYILSPEHRDVRWHARHDDEVRVFCNGATVLRRDTWDTNVDQAEDGLVADGKGLKKGLNVVTAWHEAGGGGDYFALGITNLGNVPFDDLLYSLGPSLILTDAYASRSLPDSFEPGEKVRVDLAIKVNPNNPPSSVTITESISGIPHWTPPDVWIQAPGATIVPPDRLWWVLTGPNVKNQTLSYWLTVPAEITQALRFCGTLTFGTTAADIWGENVIYPVPTAPRFVSVEMFQAAHLSWSAPVTEGTVSYKVYRSVNGGPYELIGRSESTSYTDKWVLPGDKYSYWVAAVSVTSIEGQPSRATPQVSMPIMEIRQAEDFNYDSGQYPWTAAVTLPPIEAPDANTIGTPAEYDFYHPGTRCGPLSPPWPPEYRPGVCIETVEEADNPGVFCTVISGIEPGSWYRYSFNAPEAGWIKLELRAASPGGGTLAAYWDETLVGTVSYKTGHWNVFTWALMEDQIQTTAGVHTLRVRSVSGELNFDAIAVQWNAAPPSRQTIWEDNFDNYTSTADVFSPTVGKWTRGTTTNSAGSWTLWPTEGPPLGTEPANIAWMENKYMISDSELSGEGVLLDEEMLSPEVDCTTWMRLRL
ncbi:MAG: carbohydrate-binding protein, partial [bacterium]|nr:carbohydrate-binding protein [bacterium]